MAKKKSTKASTKSATFSEAIGIKNLFYSERITFVIGFCLLFIAGYLAWAFVSYFVTGSADQSMIETPQSVRL